MIEARKPGCRACAGKDAEIAKLREQLAAAQKNSSNSSKPPSSDIVDPKKQEADFDDEAKRRIGGQPGHRAHFRELFDGLDVQDTLTHSLSCCPNCGGGVRPSGSMEPLSIDDFAIDERTGKVNACPSGKIPLQVICD